MLGVWNIQHLTLQNHLAVHVFPRQREWKDTPPSLRASGGAVGDGCRSHHVMLNQRTADSRFGKQRDPAPHDGLEDRLVIAKRVADASGAPPGKNCPSVAHRAAPAAAPTAGKTAWPWRWLPP